jgi:hypothetical protein
MLKFINGRSNLSSFLLQTLKIGPNCSSNFCTSRSLLQTASQKSPDTIKFIEETIRRFRLSDEIYLCPAQFDWNFLLDEKNFDKQYQNIQNRKSNGDLNALVIFQF